MTNNAESTRMSIRNELRFISNLRRALSLFNAVACQTKKPLVNDYSNWHAISLFNIRYHV